MGDRSKGLQMDPPKFIVRRTDGTDALGFKHDNCDYFVLDLTHDPHAVPALAAYAQSCREDGYSPLADDLDEWVANLATLAAPTAVDTCSWHEDEDGVWWTDCDNAFTLETGTPSENEMKFCCYCGRPLGELLHAKDEVDS